MADDERPTEARQLQAWALGAAEKVALKKDKKQTRTKLAADLDLGYDQYLRYVNGTTPLRVEQIVSFARAYGITPFELSHRLGLTDDDERAPVNWFRDALRSWIPEGDIDELAEEWEGRPWTNQRSAVEAIKAMAAKMRRDATA